MELSMHILTKTDKLGIDNNKKTMLDLIKKLEEETAEIRDAYDNKNDIEVGKETLDTMQMCIAILDRLEENNVDIQKLNIEHNDKLIEQRKWEIKTDVKINN